MDLVADMLFDRLSSSIRRRSRRHSSGRRCAARRTLPGVGRRRGRGASIASRTGCGTIRAIVAASRSSTSSTSSITATRISSTRCRQTRTIVTCHDLDTFRSVLDPEGAAVGAVPRDDAAHPGRASQAGHVACDSQATRDALVAQAGIAADRTTVVYQRRASELHADAGAGGRRRRRAAARALGVSSNCCMSAARSRASASTCCCESFDALRSAHRQLRLMRVGGPFTAAQQALARELGVATRRRAAVAGSSTLAAVYRRSALLLLPSEREGFGLPVVEAMACGTPVVASDLRGAREVGGYAAVYCPLDDVEAWHRHGDAAARRASASSAQWSARRDGRHRRAAAFSWSRYASDVAAIYARVAGVRRPRVGADTVRWQLMKVAAPRQVLSAGRRAGWSASCSRSARSTAGRLENRVLALHTASRTTAEEVRRRARDTRRHVGARRFGAVAPALAASCARSTPTSSSCTSRIPGRCSRMRRAAPAAARDLVPQRRRPSRAPVPALLRAGRASGLSPRPPLPRVVAGAGASTRRRCSRFAIA